jgi:AbrB family looped-hinge helix DNA binding protein
MPRSTTVTSKGTITIPSAIRKRLGITQGRKVQVSISKDNKIVVDPGFTVEEFEKVREHLVASIPKDKLGMGVRALKDAVEEAKIAEYKRTHRG